MASVDNTKYFTENDSSHMWANAGGKTHYFAPHIQNVEAGYGKYDPVHNSIFEVVFSTLKMDKTDAIRLTEQVTNVSGLDALNKVPAAGVQKFWGADVSFLNPVLEQTCADIAMDFNLNLANSVDNYVLRTFFNLSRASYDKSTGLRGAKADYIIGDISIAQANRNGDVWRAYTFHDCMITEISNLDDLDYSNTEPKKLKVTFRSDWWDDSMNNAYMAPATEG